MDSATYEFAGDSVEDVRAQAVRHFATYFGSQPFEVVDTDAEAVMTIGGDLLFWQVRVTARTLETTPR